MKKMQLNTIESVLDIIENNFKGTFSKFEIVDIMESVGRTVFEEIVSKEIIPEFPKSTVDGYAIKISDKPVNLNLVNSIEIGQVYDYVLRDNECIYVPTGGMVPSGADLVVKIEETTKVSSEEVFFPNVYKTKENIIAKGEDLNIGDVILEKGSRINTFDVGAFASLGIRNIMVLKKPTVTIISTGDELVESSQKTKIGQVRDINTKTLNILANDFGLEVINMHIVGDDYEKLKNTLEESVETSDAVIVSGGSSVGLKDYTYDLINESCMPGVLSYGIALKPGKPTIIGKHNSKPIIGLPGHPVSAVMVFRLIVKNIMSSFGFSLEDDITDEVELLDDIYAAEGRDTYQMVDVKILNKKKYAIPTSGKSGMISLLTNSNAYVIVSKEEKSIKKNTIVKCHYL